MTLVEYSLACTKSFLVKQMKDENGTYTTMTIASMDSYEEENVRYVALNTRSGVVASGWGGRRRRGGGEACVQC